MVSAFDIILDVIDLDNILLLKREVRNSIKTFLHNYSVNDATDNRTGTSSFRMRNE